MVCPKSDYGFLIASSPTLPNVSSSIHFELLAFGKRAFFFGFDFWLFRQFTLLPGVFLMRWNGRILLQRVFLPGMLALWVASAVGCGGGKATVTGKVTIDGKPLPAGRISFVPSKGGAGVGADIKDGQYTVEKVPVGSVKVTVETTTIKTKIDALTVAAQQFARSQPPPNAKVPENAKQSLEEERKEAEKKNQELKDLRTKYVPVPEKYGKDNETPITTEVKPGTNTFDVTLQSR